MKKLIIFLFIFLFCFIPKTAAQSEWTIPEFKSDIALQEDGTVYITETIAVDFASLEKHGIYRDIPYVYTDSAGRKTYTSIEVVSVEQDSAKAEYKVTQNDNNTRIRIGDPDKTINGKHIYEISYLATGILRSYSDHDELYWNATGNDWEAPIERTNVRVSIPRNTITKTTCYEGYAGSTDGCLSLGDISDTVTGFSNTNPLAPGQGLTVVVGYTRGTVPILTVAPPKKLEDDILTPFGIGAFGLAVVLGLGGIIYLWIKNGRDFWFRTPQLLDPKTTGERKPLGSHETIVVAFEPPQKLRPAELGVLVDEQADTLDVTSTIIDLATRGYLTITEIPKTWMFGSVDYELTKSPQPPLIKGEHEVQGRNDNALLPYEKLLLDKLFATGNVVKLSELKTTFYDDLAKVKEQLYKDVMTKKLFVANPETTRTKYLALAVGILVLGAFHIFIGIKIVSGPVVTAGVGFVLCGVIGLFTAKAMPSRTAYGRELYRQAKGYRLFIDGAEKYRQQFFEKKNLFNEILPYAIVFGLTKKFAAAMEKLDVKQTTPGWYIGSHPFIGNAFASDIDSFSKSLSTAIASTPSKSGGFSGGSSGGGFGGGGGGSW